jgi:cytochrome c peroxidase
MRVVFLALATTLAAALAAAPAALAADAEKGRALYDARCGGCHTQSVHGREKREATDFRSLRDWVRRWNTNLGLGWTAGEVDAVTVHLNNRYYHYPCPAEICSALGGRPMSLRRTSHVRVR